MKATLNSLLVFAFTVSVQGASAGELPSLPKPPLNAVTISTLPAKEANQAVAVDKKYFYAIDNTEIGKYNKKTGALVSQWQSPKDWPLIHFDSATIVDGKIYIAHSNYSQFPMTSSLEVFDAKSLKHIDELSHSFGIDRGSFTWIDRDSQGRWWGGFANYNKAFEGEPYGHTRNTQIVRFGKNWQIEESFILPYELLTRFEDMSNSGGSWGRDGRLYITGHDADEIYILEEPKAGSIMRWVDTIKADIKGQGIAWDRSMSCPTIYGIVRDKAAGHKVRIMQVPELEKAGMPKHCPA